MVNASILFAVPEDLGDLPDLLDRNYGVSPDYPDAVEAADIRAYLDGKEPGQIVEFDFEDHANPLDPITDISNMLSAMGGRYWAQSDAFVERSRGIRVEGIVILGMGGEPECFDIPWTHGVPEFNERTLRAAEVPEEKIAALIEWAFPESRTAVPTVR